MDLFQESRWTFTVPDKVAWYRGIVQDVLVAPRLLRFGGLTTSCAEPCAEVVGYRFATGNPLALFADVGNLEYNHVCKICLEASYTETIKQLYGLVRPAFAGLSARVLQFDATLADTDENAEQKAANKLIADNLASLSESITTDDVVDFYAYYVTRNLYAQLGAQSYLTQYKSFQQYIEACIGFLGADVCPTHPDNMTATLASSDLLRHADNTFSSVTTAGAPFPFWSQGDGTGALFVPNPTTGQFYPVSGSGIDMSGDITSVGVYVQSLTTGADPSSEEWQRQVEINPLYAWFMASLTTADTDTGMYFATFTL